MMGVPVGEARGDHPALLKCGRCGDRFETDETMDNGCPHCDKWGNIEILDGGDPADWR